MDRISAASNLTIEYDIDHWKLLSISGGQERTLLEAEKGHPLTYIEIFGSKRRLPKGGKLSLDDVQRVVVGWSHEDECWHLGLLFEPELSEQRGSRWCELARWPDPETSIFSDNATEAGRALARLLGRPFNFIEPDRSAITVKPAAAPPPPLRGLPLVFDQWTLNRQSALQLVRAGQWTRQRLMRIVWYGLLVIAYFVLSIVTLQGRIALPKPEFLPYLGIVVGVFLIGVLLYTLFELINKPNRIAITSDSVTALRGNRQAWQIKKDQINAIYVSEVVHWKGKKQTVYHGELNLHLKDGNFKTILQQPHQVEEELTTVPEPVEQVVPLTLYNSHSDLQMAGLHIAQTLGLVCQYDQRAK